MDGNLDKNEGIEQLLTLYCQGLATPDECIKVERWIDSSEENLKIASEIYRLNRSISDVEILRHIDEQKAYNKVNAQINSNRWRGVYIYAVRCAAILLIPLIFIYLLKLNNKDTVVPEQMIEVRADAGSITRVLLPDSSMVCLNGRSVLRYPKYFRAEKRNVTLDGEAYFEVTHNSSRPFVVSMPQGMKVEVLGTTFNVDAYSDRQIVKATLVEGKVNFVHKKNGADEAIALRPGERVVCNKADNSVKLYNVDAQGDIAWMEKMLVFDNTSISQVAHELEKVYNVTIIIKGSKLNSYSFTGTFEEQSIEPILEALRLSSHVQWKDCGTDKATQRRILELYIANNK